MKKQRDPSSGESDHNVVLSSYDNAVRFQLTMTPHGLWVRRTRRGADRSRVEHSVLFDTMQRFERWCDADPVRFEYPLVIMRVKREGGALLECQYRTYPPR